MKSAIIYLLVFALIIGVNITNVSAQESPSVLYVPLIGLTSVPEPLTLPDGPGNVTYQYVVKNLLSEVALTNIHLTDDMCRPVTFVEGDDNHDAKLDTSETWRYTCSTKLSETTKSIAIAIGTANTITATDKAYATVVVGSNSPPPLVSIVNATKIAYPLSSPSEITFIYKVTNPGIVPLSDVTVTDDACSSMSGKLGDTNGNMLLDPYEVWTYTCTMTLMQTITDTVTVSAFANGFQTVATDTLTIIVAMPISLSPSPLFDVGISPVLGMKSDFKTIVWIVLFAILMVLVIFFLLLRKSKLRKARFS